MKKLPQEYELDELLAAIKDTDLSTIKASYDDPILSFTQAFNITPGKGLVSSELLYKLFKLWHPHAIFTRRLFNMRLGKYVPYDCDTRFFSINKDFLSISKQLQEMLRGKKKDKRKSKAWAAHYQAFLADNGVEPGTLYIEAEILYYVYNRWRDSSRKKSLLSYENFCAISNLHFDRKKLSLSDKSWYGVNRAIKSLITREEVVRWRESKRNAKNRLFTKREKILYQEKKQKKQKQVSSS